MAATSTALSYSGAPPGNVRRANAFDWIFGDPFQQENDHTSSERRLPKIDEDRPIFVDNKTGKVFPLDHYKHVHRRHLPWPRRTVYDAPSLHDLITHLMPRDGQLR